MTSYLFTHLFRMTTRPRTTLPPAIRMLNWVASRSELDMQISQSEASQFPPASKNAELLRGLKEKRAEFDQIEGSDGLTFGTLSEYYDLEVDQKTNRYWDWCLLRVLENHIGANIVGGLLNEWIGSLRECYTEGRKEHRDDQGRNPDPTSTNRRVSPVPGRHRHNCLRRSFGGMSE